MRSRTSTCYQTQITTQRVHTLNFLIKNNFSGWTACLCQLAFFRKSNLWEIFPIVFVTHKKRRGEGGRWQAYTCFKEIGLVCYKYNTFFVSFSNTHHLLVTLFKNRQTLFLETFTQNTATVVKITDGTFLSSMSVWLRCKQTLSI